MKVHQRRGRSRRGSSDAKRLRPQATHGRTYDLKISEEALSALWYEVLAARLRLKRDKKLGRETPRGVTLLAEMNLPLVVRRYRVRKTDAGHRVDQTIKGSGVETPGVGEPDPAAGTERADAADELSNDFATDQPRWPLSRQSAAAPVMLASVGAAGIEHSGNVTLYLPKDLSRWLTDHHDASRISYPEIVLNAISWAAAGDGLSEIFSSYGNGIRANDLLGRVPVPSTPVRGSNGRQTRKVQFREDHMRVIIGLARIWTGDNRNAFFVGVLAAYRDDKIRRPAD